jgi:hypothetical protein
MIAAGRLLTVNIVGRAYGGHMARADAWSDTPMSNDTVLERFEFLVNAPALFNAVTTAVEFRIFHFLAERGSADFDELLVHTGVGRHPLRVLLQAVCATGLLCRNNGRYTNSPVAEELLATDAEDSWTHILIGWKEVYYPAFAQMTTALRAGTNTALNRYPGDEPTLYQRLSRDPELETLFHRAMSAFTLRSLDALAEAGPFGAVRHLLDVGGGDATTSIRLLECYPDLTATVFDIPSVADRAATGCPDRLRLHPGDIFDDPYPQDVDAVLFSHVLEIFSPEQILRLMTKACQVLPVGGRVIVYGYNVSDDETTGIFGARLSLYFNVLASGQGMAYPARDYENWLGQAGFSDIATIQGLPYEHGLSTAIKR